MESTVQKTVKFEGHLLTLEVHDVELEDGSTSVREIVRHPDAVCAVVLTKDGETVLVRQFRKAVESALLEIPAGKIDPGENATAAAERELREEVGYQSGKLSHLVDFYSSPGFCNEQLSLYLAEDAVLGRQELDEGELIDLVRVPLAEAVAMACDGRIQDAKSIAGLLAVARLKGAL